MRNFAEALDGVASLERLPPAPRRVLDRALAARPIGSDEALNLLTSEDAGLVEAMIATAGAVRTRLKGTVVTYSPKVFLPITNLCRDRCSYCTFRADPGDPHAWTMLPDEVRSACSRGHQLGCIEALMCLGDKPERAFRSYRATLQSLGQDSTIDYVGEACRIALEQQMLPHTNAGVMSRDEMARLRPLNVSMGLMLENVSPRLRAKGEAHYYAPDKDPRLRLQMLEEAGELRIPFTTGILLGIGETPSEVIDSLAAIRRLQAEYGHIQEVIIQNFRAKPSTPMADRPEPGSLDMARTIAVARLMMPGMNLQAPPNLSPNDHRLLLAAGINDWGGISPLTPDYVNPEAPWPHVAVLSQTCADAGFRLQPRLPIYPEYLERDDFLDPALRPAIAARTAATGDLPCC
ncbi:MAG TPA: 7,8-didemethyl-8-hydroxy-5-deazariboflavin synthase CofG [Terriglobales bacterium]|nr:7,8-didemethyl-8-hydroxy-5-deazariboflavin synthase CofG [Terriglobales bacterium]